jgi:hypothetical protein
MHHFVYIYIPSIKNVRHDRASDMMVAVITVEWEYVPLICRGREKEGGLEGAEAKAKGISEKEAYQSKR